MPQPNLQKRPNQPIIVRDYDPKKKKKTDTHHQEDPWVVSPITNQKIKASQLQNHVKYQLIDPSWKDEREKKIQEKKAEDKVYAAGSDISAHSKDFADRRTDIFGVEETALGKKVGECERKKEAFQWDGHSGSGMAVQRLASSKVTKEEQIEYTRKTLGLLTDDKLERIGPKIGDKRVQVVNEQPPKSFASAQQSVTRTQKPTQELVKRPHPMVRTEMIPRLPMPHFLQQQTSAGHYVRPPPTKINSTEGALIPTEAFIKQNPGPVQFFVQCPGMPEKNDWKLYGQRVQFKLPLTDEVTAVKALVEKETKMPAGKQKFKHNSLFMKDNNSLAYYNVKQGDVVELHVKQRGGRRR